MEVPSPTVFSNAQGQRSANLLVDPPRLSSILSDMSRELCRNLASLRAGFELILGEGKAQIPDDQRAHLLTMVSLCDDLLEFARSSLDYAVTAHGSRPLCLGSFTMGALVRELDRRFAATARSRRIQWETHTSNPESVVLTDVSRCQLILGNVVSNAFKFTPSGGRVHLAATVEDDFWRVSVSDSGRGIPGSWHERVFEPFVRLARDEQAGTEGNGLGLAICRELVAQLSGTIAMESAEDIGTSVSIRFPLVATSTAVVAPQRI